MTILPRPFLLCQYPFFVAYFSIIKMRMWSMCIVYRYKVFSFTVLHTYIYNRKPHSFYLYKIMFYISLNNMRGYICYSHLFIIGIHIRILYIV